MERLQALGKLAQRAGPYLLLELVMPGGTLLALLLYLHQRGDLRSWRAIQGRLREAADRISRELERSSVAQAPRRALPMALTVPMNH